MANISAAKSGNWSDTTVWNGGVLPGANDVAYSNTYTVTIDQDITVQRLANVSGTGITAGGAFVVSAVTGTRNISCTSGLGNVGGTFIGATGGLLQITATSGTVALGSTNIQGGATTNYVALLISGAGVTVTQSGTVTGGTGATAYGAQSTAVNTLTFGNITGGSGSSGINITASATVTTGTVTAGTTSASAHGISISGAAATLTTGTVTGGTNGGYAIFLTNASTSSVTCTTVTGATVDAINVASAATTNATINTGNIIAGTTGYAINIGQASCTVNVDGTVTANGVPAFVSTVTGTFRFKGPLYHSVNGIAPIYSTNWKVYPSTATFYQVYDDEDAPLTGRPNQLTSSATATYPGTADVRSGVSYNSTSGAVVIPAASNVTYGVAVDNTTGSAVLTQSGITSAEVATGVSLATRMLNTATTDTTGDQIAAAASA